MTLFWAYDPSERVHIGFVIRVNRGPHNPLFHAMTLSDVGWIVASDIGATPFRHVLREQVVARMGGLIARTLRLVWLTDSPNLLQRGQVYFKEW